MLFKRVYMAQEDGGGGSSQPPAGTPSPAPQASGADPKQGPATVDVQALAKEIRDGVFADLRRAGVLKKSAIREMDAANGNGQQPAAAQPTADLGAVRAFDRAMGRLGFGSVGERQYARAEKAFLEERPDDVDGWLKDYFHGYGGTPAAKPEPQAATPQAPANARPASDAGSPAGPTRPVNEVDLLRASEADVQHVLRQKGPAGLKAMLTEQLRNTRFSWKPSE